MRVDVLVAAPWAAGARVISVTHAVAVGGCSVGCSRQRQQHQRQRQHQRGRGGATNAGAVDDVAIGHGRLVRTQRNCETWDGAKTREGIREQEIKPVDPSAQVRALPAFDSKLRAYQPISHADRFALANKATGTGNVRVLQTAAPTDMTRESFSRFHLAAVS